MTQAEIISITTRRNALRLGAAATLSAVVIPAFAAPSEILSLCAEFDALQRQKIVLFNTIADEDEREWPLNDIEVLQEPLLYRLAELQATSPEEHRARARSLWMYLGKDEVNDQGESDLWDVRLGNAIMRDLAGMGA